MKLRDITLSALVATSLVVAPVAANAAPVDRSAAAVEGEQIGGRMGLGLPIAIAIFLAALLIYLSDQDENPPASP